jgi:hypothetical protein
MRVAKSGFMFCTPTLANIAVKAANIADNSAQKSQGLIDCIALLRVLILQPSSQH